MYAQRKKIKGSEVRKNVEELLPVGTPYYQDSLLPKQVLGIHAYVHYTGHSMFSKEERPAYFLFGQSIKHAKLLTVTHVFNYIMRTAAP
jgi:hypothetical protein